MLCIKQPLLNLFKICISYVISTTGFSIGLSARVCCALLTLSVNMLASCVPGSIEFFAGSIDFCQILSFVCFFQLCQSSFDSRFSISRDFIAVLFKLFFGIENQTVCQVEFFNFFT